MTAPGEVLQSYIITNPRMRKADIPSSGNAGLSSCWLHADLRSRFFAW